MIAAVSAEKRIKVYLNSVIARTSGAPGRFSVEIAAESGGITTEEVGAIVQASGFTTYDAGKLPEFAYGKTPNVVDQAGLEKLAKEAAAQGAPRIRVRAICRFRSCASKAARSANAAPWSARSARTGSTLRRKSS